MSVPDRAMAIEPVPLVSLIRSADPTAVALKDGRIAMTYGELCLRLRTLAAKLSSMNSVGDGAIVICGKDPLARALGVWLGAWCGRDVCLVEPEREGAKAIIGRVAPAIVFDDDESQFGGSGYVLPTGWLMSEPETAADGVSAGSAVESAWLVASSGTLGAARIARLPASAVLAHAHASNEVTGLSGGDTWLVPISLQHIGGLATLARCAAVGAGVFLQNGFDPAAVVGAVMSGECSHLSLVPAMLDRVIEVAGGRRPPENLRCVLVGGAALDAGLAARARAAGWPVWVAYGMTETVSHVACERIDDDWENGCVGAPLPGVRVAVDTGGDARDAGTGQIRVEGAVVTSGYVGAGGSVRPMGNVFVSGDLGRLDAEGKLHVLGRADDVLISGGVNIHPASLERAMTACPGVVEVGVTAIEDSRWGDLLVALFAGIAEESEFDAWCRLNIESARRPRHFRRIAELPRNNGGKLDREALRAIARDAFD